jgi:rubredoxin
MRNDPILNYQIGLEEQAAEGGWQQANRYSIWVGRQTADDPPYEVLERHPQGFVRFPMITRSMRLISAGTPFRIRHLFAPFRISDADMIHIRAVVGDSVYHTLLAATSQDVKQDHVVWFCPSCGTEMERAPFATQQHGLISFWPFLLEQVRAFNKVPERQICRACGETHPVCYGFDVKLDDSDEAAARTKW